MIRWLLIGVAFLAGYALRLYGELFSADRCDHLMNSSLETSRCRLRVDHFGPHHHGHWPDDRWVQDPVNRGRLVRQVTRRG